MADKVDPKSQKCRTCTAPLRPCDYGRNECGTCRYRRVADAAIARGEIKARWEYGRATCKNCGRKRKCETDGFCQTCLRKLAPTCPWGKRPAPDELEARIAYYTARASQQLPLFDPPFGQKQQPIEMRLVRYP